MKLVLLIVWGALVLMVLAATAPALIRARRHARLIAGWVPVQAVVTGATSRLYGSSARITQRRWTASYSYRTVPGGPVHTGVSDALTRRRPVEGSLLEVRVDPADPRRSSHTPEHSVLGLGCATAVLLGVLTAAYWVISALPID